MVSWTYPVSDKDRGIVLDRLFRSLVLSWTCALLYYTATTFSMLFCSLEACVGSSHEGLGMGGLL